MNKIIFPFRFKSLKDVIDKPKENPKEFMYGAYELMQKHKNIDFFLEPRGQRNTVFKKILFFFELPFTKIVKLGIPHEVYLCNRHKYAGAEKMVCINDAISFAILFWKMLGAVKAEVYALFQSLPERHLKYFSNNKIATRLITKLLSNANKIMVLSFVAKSELAKVFDVPIDKIEVFHFGADLSFWKYNPYSITSRDYILTIGNDMNRDYKTFIKAMAKGYNIIAVTHKKIDGSNIIVKTSISNSEVMALYHKARLVITPSIKLSVESSGLSTTVQAMACGTPVLVSDSPPMRELFQENKHIFYYEPENPESLACSVERVWNNERLLSEVSSNARKLVEDKLNSKNMFRQLERILEIV